MVGFKYLLCLTGHVQSGSCAGITGIKPDKVGIHARVSPRNLRPVTKIGTLDTRPAPQSFHRTTDLLACVRSIGIQ